MKKYKVIAKVDTNKFVKYNVNNLLLFVDFLDKNFGGWRWFNVYEYSKDNVGKQLDSFTSQRRPVKRFL